MSSLTSQKALPNTQPNYLDDKLIIGFEANHPKMVDASLQLTHYLILNECKDEIHFILQFFHITIFFKD